jgi:hypothetical protein
MRTPMPSPRNSNIERLFITSRGGAAYDENPDRGETMHQFMRRKGLSDDHIAVFDALCRIGAKDGENERSEAVNTGSRDPYMPPASALPPGGDEQMGKIREFARDRLQGDDVGTFEGLVEELMRCLGGEGEAADDLPTYRSNGMPRNSIDSRHAMDARITTGTDTFGHGHDRGPVPMPADRKPKSDAAKYAPGISRITIGA